MKANAIKLLKFAGFLWLVITFARVVGRIQGAGAVVGFWNAVNTLDWVGLIVDVALGGMVIGIAFILESRQGA